LIILLNLLQLIKSEKDTVNLLVKENDYKRQTV
jgi:hypothetical protein